MFGANHQNALMDALAVIMTSNYQPVYLARADLFKKPLIARILRFFKIMPVYRFRDGIETMGQNEETFKKTTAVLKSGGCIGIMPEGNHGEEKRLRVLKKGVFRIAFKAEEEIADGPGIRVVPVGLDFTNTSRFLESLVVNFGEPLPVSDYLDEYSIHPQKGINAMRDDLAESLSLLMIDVRDEGNYNKDKLLVDTGSPVLEKSMKNKHPRSLRRFLASRAFCEAMYEWFDSYPDKADRLRTKIGRFGEIMDRHGLCPHSLTRMSGMDVFLSLLKKLLCFPLFIIGFLLNLIPLAVINQVLKKIKDPQFISSFKFVLGMLLVPVNYILLALFAFHLLDPLSAATIVVLAPVTGFTAYNCYRYSRRLRNSLNFNRVCREDKEAGGLILDLRQEIINDLDPVFKIAREKIK